MSRPYNWSYYGRNDQKSSWHYISRLLGEVQRDCRHCKHLKLIPKKYCTRKIGMKKLLVWRVPCLKKSSFSPWHHYLFTIATLKLVKLSYKLLPHPPYSPGLAPQGLFCYVSKHEKWGSHYQNRNLFCRVWRNVFFGRLKNCI